MAQQTQKDISGIPWPAVFRKGLEYERMIISRRETAVEAVGLVGVGQTVCILTHGQFSLIDLVAHVVTLAGRGATLDLSTWTGVQDEYHILASMLDDGRLSRIRVLLDRSSYGRETAACEYLAKRIGAENIRTTRNHCKVAVVCGPDGDFSIRSSMNLNMNPRIENADITNDEELAKYYRAFFDYCFENLAPEDWRGVLPGGTEHGKYAPLAPVASMLDDVGLTARGA